MRASTLSLRPDAGTRGFTLIELMVTIAILGILASLAEPAYTSVIANQRVKTAASDMYISLTSARSEALKRNANITIAPVGSSWQSGWVVQTASNATLSRVVAPSDVTVGTTTDSSLPASIVYTASGRLQGSSAPSFLISSPHTSSKRCVSIDLSGRPYIKASAC